MENEENRKLIETDTDTDTDTDIDDIASSIDGVGSGLIVLGRCIERGLLAIAAAIQNRGGNG